MAHKVIWSPEVLADLTEIRDFIARDSEIFAIALVERVLTTIDLLAEFPRLGKRVPEIDDETLR